MIDILILLKYNKRRKKFLLLWKCLDTIILCLLWLIKSWNFQWTIYIIIIIKYNNCDYPARWNLQRCRIFRIDWMISVLRKFINSFDSQHPHAVRVRNNFGYRWFHSIKKVTRTGNWSTVLEKLGKTHSRLLRFEKITYQAK